MKKLILTLFTLVILVGCKKSSNTTPQPSSTNNGTGNNTTNDTTGKVKIFYSLQMNPLTVGYGTGCTGRDYKQDTNNVRIYLNNAQLHSNYVNMSTSPDKLGLNVLENGLISSLSHTVTPVWCNVGDSIVVVFDSLEVNGTSAAQTDHFQRMQFTITKNGSTMYSFDTYQYGNWASILDPYYIAAGNGNKLIGTTKISGLTQNWFIWGRFRLVYHVQ